MLGLVCMMAPLSLFFQIHSSLLLTTSSDLWALGVIIFQLLSGEAPFRGGNEYQTFKLITSMTYSFPEGFPQRGEVGPASLSPPRQSIALLHQAYDMFILT